MKDNVEDLKLAYIYQIKNLVNGKVYIGSTNDYKRRIRKHKYELKNNKHTNKHLQRSWNIHGENNFDFKIIKTCKINKQFEVEGKEIEKCIKNYGDSFVYNIIKNPIRQMEDYKIRAEIKALIGKGYIYCAECGELYKLDIDEIDELNYYAEESGLEIHSNICFSCSVDLHDDRIKQLQQEYYEELDEHYLEEGMGEYTPAHLSNGILQDMISSGYYED